MAKSLNAPPVVYAALARHQLAPDEVKRFEVTEDDVYLYLKMGMTLRIEISSLPESVVMAGLEPALQVEAEPEPETTQAARATRKPSRAGKSSKSSKSAN